MAFLVREAIMQKHPFEMVEVDVSEWGDINPETGERERTTTFVREMSVRERGEFEKQLELAKSVKNGKIDVGMVDVTGFRERLILMTCCDADGNLLFRPEDAEYLAQQPSKVIERICLASLKLNRLTADTSEAEQVKN